MWGNSLAVRIPKEISNKLRLRSGSAVRILADKKSVTIRPIKEKKANLHQLVLRINDKNKHSVQFAGKPYGSEEW